jgi:ankyrin repeat protein
MCRFSSTLRICSTICALGQLSAQLRLLFYLLDVVDFRGRSLLSIASMRRSEPFVTLLLDAGAPIDGLSNGELMSLVNGAAAFNRLLARGVDFTAMRDEHGATLCHHVASNVTSEDDLRFLVNVCGKDAIHAVDNYGRTPLHRASSDGNNAAVRVLVELGAEIDQEDSYGWTALTSASAGMKSSCVELLLALDADVGLVSRRGHTACHLAAQCRQCGSLCALVAAGGDLDRPDDKGETPRMIAIRMNVVMPPAGVINVIRRRIAKTRLDLVRERAFQICLGLQSFRLNALQLCEILMHSFGALGSLIAFHKWWAIATKVKHFRDHKQQSSA